MNEWMDEIKNQDTWINKSKKLKVAQTTTESKCLRWIFALRKNVLIAMQKEFHSVSRTLSLCSYPSILCICVENAMWNCNTFLVVVVVSLRHLIFIFIRLYFSCRNVECIFKHFECQMNFSLATALNFVRFLAINWIFFSEYFRTNEKWLN